MGGMFMVFLEEYRDYFIWNLYDVLLGYIFNNIYEVVKYFERSFIKCIGIIIEIRLDYCMKWYLSDMLIYGCIRLEIGV